jgi:excisionase family DNA binding protein
MDDDQLLTLDETVELIDLPQERTSRLLREGLLPGTKVSGRWRVRREDIDAWNRDEAPLLANWDSLSLFYGWRNIEDAMRYLRTGKQREFRTRPPLRADQLQFRRLRPDQTMVRPLPSAEDLKFPEIRPEDAEMPWMRKKPDQQA